MPGLVHRTERGAVAVNLADVEAIWRAVPALLALEPTRVEVQPYVVGGDEWLVGAVRDGAGPPLVTVGAGGVFTEVWTDVARRLAPLAPRDLRALTSEPRFAATLDGWRGAPARDRAALERFAELLSRLALAHPEVADIECNLVLVLPRGRGVVAVDVRARLAPLPPS